MMKYKVGDKVRIKSIEWYEANKDPDGDVNCGELYFTSIMKKYFGQEMTIRDVYDAYYSLDGIDFYWTDEMLEESDILKAAEELIRAKKEFEKAKENLKKLLA